MSNIADKPNNGKSVMIRIGIYIVAYGILMGLRSEFDDFWMKTAMAACAGAFLGMALYEGQKIWRGRK